jgi:hypothetical protein
MTKDATVYRSIIIKVLNNLPSGTLGKVHPICRALTMVD